MWGRHVCRVAAFEGKDAHEEHDVLAVELFAGGVDLEGVVRAM